MSKYLENLVCKRIVRLNTEERRKNYKQIKNSKYWLKRTIIDEKRRKEKIRKRKIVKLIIIVIINVIIIAIIDTIIVIITIFINFTQYEWIQLK